ncbi:MAG: porin [Pusillimonas sp.]
MKLKALAAGLALSFPMLASAQGTSVTLYGVIDTAVHYVNNISSTQFDPVTGRASIVNNSYTGFSTQTNSWPSMWGLRGSEKISDNLDAIFNLESGFNPNVGTSNQGGRLFGRAAWVGLKGDWGQVTIGRQYSMLFYAMMRSTSWAPTLMVWVASTATFPIVVMTTPSPTVAHSPA